MDETLDERLMRNFALKGTGRIADQSTQHYTMGQAVPLM